MSPLQKPLRIAPLIQAMATTLLLFGVFTTDHISQADNHIIFVNDNATGANDGSSWTNAYTQLQTALASAGAGKEIWVAAGIYYPDQGTGQTDNSAASTFNLKSGVALYGGFAGGETELSQRNVAANLTVLSGDIDGNDPKDDNGIVTDPETIAGTNARHVVSAHEVNASGRLDGFVVTAGVAPLDALACPEVCGGGIYINGGGPTLANLTIIGNFAVFGGGIYVDHIESTLTNVTFRNNIAASGGGIFSTLSKLTLIDVNLDHNAADSGGGLYDDRSALTLTKVVVNGNVADIDGGGMYSNEGSAIFTDVNFNGNRAEDGSGGGLYLLSSVSVTLTNTIFGSNNALAGSGGGIFNHASHPVLVDVTFTDNYASTGGGLYSTSSAPSLTRVTFRRNEARDGDGGGMVNDMGNPRLTDVLFSQNHAPLGFGGGFSTDNSRPTLTNVTFKSNRAIVGGGLVNHGQPLLTNVTFTGNYATSSGGGMATFGAGPNLVNVLFSGNHAEGDGGGLYNEESSIIFTNVTFSGNVAARGGAILNFDTSYQRLQNTIVWGNSPDNIRSFFGDPAFTYSLIEGLNPSGIGNLDGTNPNNNPRFVRLVNCGADGCGDNPATPADESANDDYGDLRLQPTSSAIDVGNNTADLNGPDDGTMSIADIATDLAGKPRIVAAKSLPAMVDLGAYEAQPTAHTGGPYSGNEGSSIALNGSASTHNAAITTYAWDCTNDGTTDVSAATPTGSACTYAQDGSYTLRLTVTYNGNATDTATTTVNVANVAPVYTAPPNQSTHAGSVTPFILGAFTDPGAEGGWAITVNWGDNSPLTQVEVNSPGDLPNSSHSYATAGTYNVVVTVNDGDASHSGGFQIVVNPAIPGAPVVTAPATQLATVGVEKPFNLGSFTDEGSSGPWQVTVMWGDNSEDTSFSVASSGALPTRSHTYATTGEYNALVTVSDSALATAASFRVNVAEVGAGASLFLPTARKPALVSSE